jgi:Holliday junction resolvase RusA-like endonuclease
MEYNFEVEGRVVGKERPRVNMNTGIVYTPNKTKDYELLVQQSFRLKYPRAEEIKGRVGIDIIAYIKIPKNTSKKKTELMLANEISPTQKPDIDNIAKSLLDAMNKLVFHDDNEVSKISVEKRFALEDKTYIRVYEY